MKVAKLTRDWSALGAAFIGLCATSLSGGVYAAIPGHYASVAIPTPAGTTNPGYAATWSSVTLTGINNSGQVVGTAYESGVRPPPAPSIGLYNDEPFLYSDGSLALLGTANLPLAIPEAISNNGTIVGFDDQNVSVAVNQLSPYIPYDGAAEGAVFPMDTFAPLPISAALAVNSQGQMVGYNFYTVSHQPQSVLYSNGQTIVLPALNPSVAFPTKNFAQASTTTARSSANPASPPPPATPTSTPTARLPTSRPSAVRTVPRPPSTPPAKLSAIPVFLAPAPPTCITPSSTSMAP